MGSIISSIAESKKGKIPELVNVKSKSDSVPDLSSTLTPTMASTVVPTPHSVQPIQHPSISVTSQHGITSYPSARGHMTPTDGPTSPGAFKGPILHPLTLPSPKTGGNTIVFFNCDTN
jgi:hypothetical protein